MGVVNRWKMAAFLTLCGLGLLFFSCEDPSVLSGDKSFIRSKLQTVFIDTFSVKLSTTLIDSIPTSNNNLLLVGNYQDSFLGKVSASTYFQVGATPLTQGFQRLPIESNSKYDSIGLILHYTRYSYGDTTQSITFNVHELTKQLTFRPLPQFPVENPSIYNLANAIYNTSTSDFEPIPLTTKITVPRPYQDSLYIPLPLAFGKVWFDSAKADVIKERATSIFTNSSRFIDYFKGLHINSKNSGASIVGFSFAKSKIRLYYSRSTESNNTQANLDFPLINNQLQFNSITPDRSATVLSGLKRRQSIPSSATGNVSFVQSGTGITTRVELPTVKGFLNDKRIVLLDAYLEVFPVQNTYVANRPPTTLVLFTTDKSNVATGIIPPVERSTYLSSNIFYDFEYGRNTRYTFTLTNYISSQLLTETSSIAPFLIGTVAPSLANEINRVVIGDSQNPSSKIKLKIYYSYAPQ
jgi:Domain of unknown function (DUF4270)